jgi:hypothetical protein
MSLDQGQEFYKQEDIDAYRRRNTRPDGTIIDYAQHSSNLEYELSLKEAAKRMYTETGRRLAQGKISFHGRILQQTWKGTERNRLIKS